MLAAGIIGAIIGFYYAGTGEHDALDEAVRKYRTEFAELFLFLLAAMTYVNSMSERNLFDALRRRLVSRRFNYRSLFWLTGVISFFLSALIDKLTSAWLMCAVVVAVGRDSTRFIAIGCTNIVVAANAGGAFSPFGDITTLMVWQRGLAHFSEFLALFVPSVVNDLVPAVFMFLAVPRETPQADLSNVQKRRGAKRIILLFGITITMAVCFHNFLHLPPFLGMITGLAFLKIFGY